MKHFFCLALIVSVQLVHCRSPFFSTETEEMDSSEQGGPFGRRITSCNCGWANKAGLRVVGGRYAKINEYPFIVSLIDAESNFNFCGGTIVTNYHVITAAHCTDGYTKKESSNYGKPLVISAGDHDIRVDYETDKTQVVPVRKIFQHVGYVRGTFNDDIAVLFLEKPLKFNQAVGPACMLSSQMNFEKETVKVIGWGRISHTSSGSPIVKSANLRIVPHDKCLSTYSFLSNPERKQVCTHGQQKGACMGDSGGPLVRHDPDTNRYFLVGVVSFGRICASPDPTVYTDPSAYLDWIKRQIADSSPSNMCYKV